MIAALVLSGGCADSAGEESLVAPIDVVGATSSTIHDPAMSPLIEDRGCDRAFKKTDIEQRVAMVLEPQWGVESTTIEAVSELPSPLWQAKILVGENLMAHNCGDTFSADDPKPRVDERWTIIEATIEAVDLPATAGFASIQLSGIRARRPDGTVADFGDVTITNTVFGVSGGA